MASPSPIRPRLTIRRRRPIVWSLVAAVALFGSAGLQQAASLTRWVTLRDVGIGTTIEDHLYDYTFPGDPWESLGSMAVQYGAGLLLASVAVVMMAGAANNAVNSEERTRLDVLSVATVAGWFALSGVHALISGLTGSPTPLQHLYLLMDIPAVVDLLYLAMRSLSTSGAISAAYVLLLALTFPGLVIATFQIAPAITDYQSHDTTPWTETILAAATGIAAILVLINAIALALAPLVNKPATHAA